MPLTEIPRKLESAFETRYPLWSVIILLSRRAISFRQGLPEGTGVAIQLAPIILGIKDSHVTLIQNVSWIKIGKDEKPGSATTEYQGITLFSGIWASIHLGLIFR